MLSPSERESSTGEGAYEKAPEELLDDVERRRRERVELYFAVVAIGLDLDIL